MTRADRQFAAIYREQLPTERETLGASPRNIIYSLLRIIQGQAGAEAHCPSVNFLGLARPYRWVIVIQPLSVPFAPPPAL